MNHNTIWVILLNLVLPNPIWPWSFLSVLNNITAYFNKHTTPCILMNMGGRNLWLIVIEFGLYDLTSPVWRGSHGWTAWAWLELASEKDVWGKRPKSMYVIRVGVWVAHGLFPHFRVDWAINSQKETDYRVPCAYPCLDTSHLFWDNASN